MGATKPLSDSFQLLPLSVDMNTCPLPVAAKTVAPLSTIAVIVESVKPVSMGCQPGLRVVDIKIALFLTIVKCSGHFELSVVCQ